MKFSWFAVLAILFGLVMTTTAQSRKSSVCAESSKDSAASETNVILSVCNHTFGMAPLIQPRLFFRLYTDGQAEFETDAASDENTSEPNHGLLLKKMRVEPKDVETIRNLIGENNFQNSKAEYPVFQRWTDSSLQTTIIVYLKGLEKKIVVNNYSSLDKNNKNHYPPSLHALLEKVYELRTEKKLSNGFNIYLLPDNISPNQLAALDIKKLKPTGEPIISARDFQSYLRDRHEISFFYEGLERLRKLKISPEGKSFIAFMGDEPIYTGAFWKFPASQNFNGLAIDLTNIADDSPTVKIAAKYPEVHPKIRLADERQDDARSDRRIMQSLEQAGVLFEELKLSGKCLKIQPTGWNSVSYFFTFKVTKDHKENFGKTEITFLAHNQPMNKFLEAIEAKGNHYDAEGLKFNAGIEIFLKLRRQIKQTNPEVILTHVAALK